MDAAQFRLPVRIIVAPDEAVREIYSAEEALEFLMIWPHQDGPIYERAMNACFSATIDEDVRAEAERSFLGFARASGILARDMIRDVLYFEGENLHLPT